MRTRRARLLPDRTAKLEFTIYLLGAGLTTAGLAVTLLFSPGSQPAGQLATHAITVVSGLAVAVLALARRPRPDLLPTFALAVAALTATAGVVTCWIDREDTAEATIASYVVFAAAVRRCPPRVAVVSGFLAAVTVVISVYAEVAGAPRPGGGLPPTALPGALVSQSVGWAIALLVGLLLRARDGSRRVEALARVRASERLLVARELHDLVARHVTGMVVRTQALGVVAPDLPAPARAALDDIESAGNDALAAMRRMVGVLRDTDGALADLEDLPTAATDVASAVQGAIDESDGVTAAVRVEVDDAVATATAPPRELLTTVHRLVAEALTNAARHAPAATDVVVGVTRDGDDLVVAVANDGVGPAARRGLRRGGYGLVGMGERVRALGGSLSSGPEGVDRWVVTARVPAPQEVAERY